MVGGISGLAFGWWVEALRAPPHPNPLPRQSQERGSQLRELHRFVLA